MTNTIEVKILTAAIAALATVAGAKIASAPRSAPATKTATTPARTPATTAAPATTAPVAKHPAATAPATTPPTTKLTGLGALVAKEDVKQLETRAELLDRQAIAVLGSSETPTITDTASVTSLTAREAALKKEFASARNVSNQARHEAEVAASKGNVKEARDLEALASAEEAQALKAAKQAIAIEAELNGAQSAAALAHSFATDTRDSPVESVGMLHALDGVASAVDPNAKANPSATANPSQTPKGTPASQPAAQQTASNSAASNSAASNSAASNSAASNSAARNSAPASPQSNPGPSQATASTPRSQGNSSTGPTNPSNVATSQTTGPGNGQTTGPANGQTTGPANGQTANTATGPASAKPTPGSQLGSIDPNAPLWQNLLLAFLEGLSKGLNGGTTGTASATTPTSASSKPTTPTTASSNPNPATPAKSPSSAPTTPATGKPATTATTQPATLTAAHIAAATQLAREDIALLQAFLRDGHHSEASRHRAQQQIVNLQGILAALGQPLARGAASPLPTSLGD